MLASAMTAPLRGAAFDAAYGNGEWWMEEKFDGHRVMVVVQHGTVTAYARPRRAERRHARALPAAMVDALVTLPAGVYDGELVAAGGKSWDVTRIGAPLVFIAFDVPLVGGPLQDRRSRLLDALARLPGRQQSVSTVELAIPSWRQVESIWRRGGEGAILKRALSGYQPGRRSRDWVKVKASGAATLTIIGYTAGKSGPHSILRLRDEDGIETTVKTLGHQLLAAIDAQPRRFLGKRVVISFQEKTPAGTYRHGIFDHFAGDGE
jgi:bifunctional non-homologous end joining protein LigD